MGYANPVMNNQIEASGHRWFRRKFFWVLGAIVIILASYFTWDYRGPSEITLQPDIVFGLHCLRAKDLLIQGHDQEGYLWATHGMVAYRLREDESKFVRQYHIPTGFSIFWFRNFSIVRRLTLRPECVELLSMPNGEACAMSAGHMWYRPPHGESFRETLNLPHYGLSTGQGVRNDGLVRLSNGNILVGEYFMNINRSNVKIYASKDNGKTWQVAYIFEPGQIRHVHAVQQDPYTKKTWICTGIRTKNQWLPGPPTMVKAFILLVKEANFGVLPNWSLQKKHCFGEQTRKTLRLLESTNGIEELMKSLNLSLYQEW